MRDRRSSPFLCLLLAAALQGQEPAPRPDPVKLPLVYGVAPRGKEAIQIDGEVGEWVRLRSIPLLYPFQVTGGKDYRGPRDLIGRAFLCWDPEALYAVVAVRDDFHRPAAGLGGGYNPAGPSGDGVFLRFDPRRDTRSLGRAPERQDDRELWLGGLGESGASALWIDRPGGRMEEAKEVAAAFRRTTPAQAGEPFELWYEARIPWRSLLPEGGSPAPGLALGFELVLEDFDSPVDPLAQTRLGWTFGEGGVLYPGQQGTLLLLAEPLAEGMEPGAVPPRPMPRRVGPEESLAPEFWEEAARGLDQLPPGTGRPGQERLALLERIDAGLAAWPALDLGLYVARYQRGMMREVAGMEDRGAPVFLKLRSRKALEVFAGSPPRRGEVRLVRLPWSGWLVRSQLLTLAVDPFLPGLHQQVRQLDAILLSNALDPVRRDDPAGFGMVELQRFVLTHVPWILPHSDTSRLPRLRPGEGANLGELSLRVLGPRGKGVDPGDQVGFEIRYLPSGPRLVFGGWRFDPSWLASSASQPAEEPPVDVLALPAGLPKLEEAVRRVGPRLFLPTDCLDLPLDPAGKADMRLAAALARLEALSGVEWRLLAWGEEVLFPSGAK